MCFFLHPLTLKPVGMYKLLILFELLIQLLLVEVKLFLEAKELKVIDFFEFLRLVQILTGVAIVLQVLIVAEGAVFLKVWVRRLWCVLGLSGEKGLKLMH